MGSTNVMLFELELNVVQIKTTVTDDLKVIDEHIQSFLHPTENHGTKVIGFDTEWRSFTSHDHDKSCQIKVPSFQLCDGKSCLIFHPYFYSSHEVPHSLHDFLRHPNYTFVGCGIKDNFVNLEKHNGIGCKNAVELGTLAATLMDEPHLRFCGVDELAFIVDELDLRKGRPLTLAFNWADRQLSEELIKLATINVYSYHKIGSALLAKYKPQSLPPVRCVCLI